MRTRVIFISFFLILGMGLRLLTGVTPSVSAAPQAELHVCSSGCPYATVQAAVTAASAGTVIKIAAGTYQGVTTHGVLKQMVYIDKALTLQGGFTSSNWTTADSTANPTTLDAQGQGRVLYLSLHTSDVTIDGLRLINGDATQAGDALAIYGGAALIWGWDQASTVTLLNSQVLNNTAQTGGGGIEFWQVKVILSGNTFSGNVGKKTNDGHLASGGAVLLSYSPAQITGNQFTSNTVPNDDYYGDSGGAIYAERGALTVSANTFSSNQANEGGALAAFRSPLTLTNNQFISNTANQGGGLYYGTDTDPSSTVTMSRNSFSNNNAGDGGGAWLLAYQSTITSNIFDHNTAIGKGGGLVSGGSLVVLQANSFTLNTSTFQGGGLYLTGTPQVKNNLVKGNTSHYGGGVAISGFGSTHPVLTNNMIVDNVVVNINADPIEIGHGSAVYIEGELADLVHTTLARNTGGDGSCIYATLSGGRNSTLLITNAIIANETLGLTVQVGSQVTLNGILWYSVNTQVAAAVPGSVSVQHEYTGDPRFAADGQHILTDSWAVDHGVAAGTTTDYDAQLRPNGSAPDLGADEYYPPNLYLPKTTR